MKKVLVIITVILAVFLISYEILWHNSFALALSSVDFSANQITVLDQGNTDMGDYRVVAQMEDSGYRLISFQTNKLGWWTAKGLLSTYDDNPVPLKTYTWTNYFGIQYYQLHKKVNFIWQNHTVYCGSNATALIQTSAMQLPDGVALKVHQEGEHYLLHFISHGDPAPTAGEAYAMIAQFCTSP